MFLHNMYWQQRILIGTNVQASQEPPKATRNQNASVEHVQLVQSVNPEHACSYTQITTHEWTNNTPRRMRRIAEMCPRLMPGGMEHTSANRKRVLQYWIPMATTVTTTTLKLLNDCTHVCNIDRARSLQARQREEPVSGIVSGTRGENIIPSAKVRIKPPPPSAKSNGGGA